jgi:hypothetical protein
MKKITTELLATKNPCPSELRRFGKEFPGGATPTLANCRRAAKLGFNTDWFAQNFLTPTAWEAYEKAIATALKAYGKAEATAWEAYVKAKATAEEAYEKATAPAWEAYKKAKATAEEAYEKATAPAWKAYKKAKAIALFRALQIEKKGR